MGGLPKPSFGDVYRPGGSLLSQDQMDPGGAGGSGKAKTTLDGGELRHG